MCNFLSSKWLFFLLCLSVTSLVLQPIIFILVLQAWFLPCHLTSSLIYLSLFLLTISTEHLAASGISQFILWSSCSQACKLVKKNPSHIYPLCAVIHPMSPPSVLGVSHSFLSLVPRKSRKTILTGSNEIHALQPNLNPQWLYKSFHVVFTDSYHILHSRISLLFSNSQPLAPSKWHVFYYWE